MRLNDSTHPRWSRRRVDAHFLDRVRAAACPRWPLSLQTLGISRKLLDGAPHRCFVCGGEFRFLDDGNGSFACRGGSGRYLARGDGFAMLSHLGGVTFTQAARAVAGTLGVEELELDSAA